MTTENDLPLVFDGDAISPALEESLVDTLVTKCESLQGKVKLMAELIAEFAKHDSWRCAYYSECHCGLDDATDQLQLPRIPYPPQG